MPNAFSWAGVGAGGGGACLRSLGVPVATTEEGPLVGVALEVVVAAAGVPLLAAGVALLAAGAELARPGALLAGAAAWLRAISADVSDAAISAAAVKSPELSL